MLTYREFCRQMMPDVHDGNLLARKYGEYFRTNAKVGDGVTVHLYSDAHAYTIVRRTHKSLTLRRCIATLAPEFKPEFVQGTAHCINNFDQAYTYSEDEHGEVVTAYWSGKKQCFCVHGDQRVTPGRHEFYDYNF